MDKPDCSTAQRDKLFPSFGPPIPEARPGTWQWVDFPNTSAGSGKPTGMALNFSPSKNASRLVIYFQAGGACWDYATSSMHFGGYGAVFHLGGFTRYEWDHSWLSGTHRKMWLFDREDPTNPFHDAHFAYFPYCTGDLYAGDSVRVFRGPMPFLKRTLHFRGQSNVRAYLARLAPTFPNLSRVYLVGSSAGGFGATFSWWLANEAWKTVRIDVISDAGQPVLIPQRRFDRLIDTWGPQLPDDGPECRQAMIKLLEYGERRYLGPDRYALITTRKDAVISAFFGMLPARHAALVDELKERFLDDSARYPNTSATRYFIMDGYGHTVFPTNHVRRARIGNMALVHWLNQMVREDPEWRSWYCRDGRVTVSPHAA